MRARIELQNPDAAIATVTISAPIGEWRKVREQLINEYPSWCLSSLLREVITKAEAHFDAKDEVTP